MINFSLYLSDRVEGFVYALGMTQPWGFRFATCNDQIGGNRVIESDKVQTERPGERDRKT